MSVACKSEKPIALVVVAPDEAVRRAKPVPRPAALAIDGLTDDEWGAFERALADR